MDKYQLIIVVLACLLSPAKAAVGLSANAISAAMTTIIAGTSLAGTTMSGLMDDGYRVTCGIELENWSKFALSDATVRIGDGAVTVPPLNVLPGKREAMVARKTSGMATGSWGTVSWLVESDPPRRLVVMWSAPFNFDHYSNWMAVGLTAPNVTKHPSGNQWFDQMYYNDNTDTLKFERKEYRSHTTPARILDDRFMVVGSMGTSHKAHIKIVFRPRNVCDTSSQIRALLEKEARLCQ